MDKVGSTLSNIIWNSVIIVNSYILLKNFNRIKNVLYQVYNDEFNDICFKGLCYIAKINAYLDNEELNEGEYTYKCIDEYGECLNKIISSVNITNIHDNSLESNNIIDLLYNTNNKINFVIKI